MKIKAMCYLRQFDEEWIMFVPFMRRSIISISPLVAGCLVGLLIAAGAQAQSVISSPTLISPVPDSAAPVSPAPVSPAIALPKAPLSGTTYLVQVQTVDPATRIMQLEEQIRQLTGRIEDLGFQMLQMQEQIRQMQQDNEFRFQDLEDSARAGGASGDRAVAAPKTDRPNETDAQANIATVDPAINSQVSDANAVYKSGYAHVLAGEYAQATSVFQDYINLYPNGAEISDAYYWLGESLYSQGAFKDAARIFLDAHKTFPQATKAPDTLLKLGMALMALDNRETACVTYDEVLARYPTASNAIKERVASEKSRAQC